MDDTPEIIRQRMEVTKERLLTKLQTLEQQVSQTVQSTGTAVNAVQETVETVTGAMHNAEQFVSDAIDVRRQFQRHPWLVLGGLAALGYLGTDFVKRLATKKSEPPAQTVSANPGNGTPPAVSVVAVPVPVQESSTLRQLHGVAISTIIGVVGEVAARAVPHVLDYFMGNWTRAKPRTADETDESQDSPGRESPGDSGQRLRIAASDQLCAGNSIESTTGASTSSSFR